MFSTTIKRSVATLGVVAGLLAAAGPASAGTPGGVSANMPNDATVKAPTSQAPTNNTDRDAHVPMW